MNQSSQAPEPLEDPDSTLPADAAGTDSLFVVAGIGASAGGLDACSRFLRHLQYPTGIAWVIVQHLDPQSGGELVELLQRHSRLPVLQAADEVQVRPDHVYVIPAAKTPAIRRGRLHLTAAADVTARAATIDLFLRSLAVDRKERAMCVILSGTGSSGTVGLKSVKEAGGAVLVQHPDDAEHPGMPRSAIATSMADLVAPVEQLAARAPELASTGAIIDIAPEEAKPLSEEAASLRAILARVLQVTGHDFSRYKRSTILRRIGRRMQVHQRSGLADYLSQIDEDRREVAALARDFLVSVTSFFRDPGVFDALGANVIPGLFKDREANEAVRVWVPGCATGEEAYSLAMLIWENAPPHIELDIQIFATDLDRDALAAARRGRYPSAIAADVSPARLRRHFIEEDDHYLIGTHIQDMVLFAHHDLLRDPPFGRLDLVSCRNLLIYIERDVQQQALRIFHYATRPSGHLILGTSESIDGGSDLFSTVDKRHRIYQRRALLPDARPIPALPRRFPGEVPHRLDAAPTAISFGDLHRRLLLEDHAPPSVVIDRHYEIRHIFGSVADYLRVREGDPSHSLLHAILPALRIELRGVVFRALQSGARARSRPVAVTTVDGQRRSVIIGARTVKDAGANDDYLLVDFLAGEPVSADETTVPEPSEQSAVRHLELELENTRQGMQTAVEELEASNEELRASNEELQSLNEELRSTTEELETSREELQSTNEELQAGSQELKVKVDELRLANGDLRNLISAIGIASIFLDRELRVSRFTPDAVGLFNLIPADIGRPFDHVSHHLVGTESPAAMARQVLTTLQPMSKEVEGSADRWFVLGMHPYRSAEGAIEGVVMTLPEITAQKRTERRLTARSREAGGLVALGEVATKQGEDLGDLFVAATRIVAETLNVEYAKILQLEPGGKQLRLRAGVGWDEGIVGAALVEADPRSQAGYTLTCGRSVVLTDMATEARFTPPALLVDHHVQSGLSVVIHGPREPFGVLGAHTTRLRQFGVEEVRFVEAVVLQLEQALGRQAAQAELNLAYQHTDQKASELSAVIHSMPDAVFIADARGVVTTNEAGLRLAGVTAVEEFGATIAALGERLALRDAASGTPLTAQDHPLAQAALGQPVAREVIARSGDPASAREVYLRVAAAPIRVDGRITGAVAIKTDITGGKRNEETLRAQAAQLADAAAVLEDQVARRTVLVRKLAHDLTMAAQRERRSVALVLHDDMQQVLYALQAQLHMLAGAAAASESARNVHSRCRELVNRAIHVTRTLTVDLSPPILATDTLAEALAWLGDQMATSHGLTVEVDSSNGVPALSAEERTLVFNFVRELLFNVVKHSGTRAATVRIDPGDGELVVSVKDKGRGFDRGAEPAAAGFGLKSIRERLDLFDGSLHIKSTPGAGVTVTFRVPFPRRASGRYSEEDVE